MYHFSVTLIFQLNIEPMENEPSCQSSNISPDFPRGLRWRQKLPGGAGQHRVRVLEPHSMDLSITTDEGDTVSLSIASTMQTEAGIYRSDADVDGHPNESASFNLTYAV